MNKSALEVSKEIQRSLSRNMDKPSQILFKRQNDLYHDGKIKKGSRGLRVKDLPYFKILRRCEKKRKRSSLMGSFSTSKTNQRSTARRSDATILNFLN